MSTLKAFNQVIEIDLGARWPWTHFRIHADGGVVHLVWGKLSIVFGQYPEVCCCAWCHSPVETLSSGDEGWDRCTGCGTIEGETVYLTEDKVEAV